MNVTNTPIDDQRDALDAAEQVLQVAEHELGAQCERRVTLANEIDALVMQQRALEREAGDLVDQGKRSEAVFKRIAQVSETQEQLEGQGRLLDASIDKRTDAVSRARITAEQLRQQLQLGQAAEDRKSVV